MFAFVFLIPVYAHDGSVFVVLYILVPTLDMRVCTRCGSMGMHAMHASIWRERQVQRYARAQTHAHTRTHERKDASVCVCVCVCARACVCVCMYMYIYNANA